MAANDSGKNCESNCCLLLASIIIIGYNAYCLADDIMEPYRPYVDRLVFQMSGRYDMSKVELTKSQKAELLSIPTFDVQISGKRSPLMIAVGQSSN